MLYSQIITKLISYGILELTIIVTPYFLDIKFKLIFGPLDKLIEFGEDFIWSLRKNTY